MQRSPSGSQPPLWPEYVVRRPPAPPRGVPGRARSRTLRNPRVRHLADALALLDLPEAAANLRALAHEDGRAPAVWIRWGLADEHGVTGKGASVLERVERLRRLGIAPHDLMRDDGLGVLRYAWNLVALRAAACPHPSAWRREGLVDEERRLTSRGAAVLTALEDLAYLLDVPFGSL
jgi:hypothetical protein